MQKRQVSWVKSRIAPFWQNQPVLYHTTLSWVPSTVYMGRESRLQWNPYKGQRFRQRHMCLRCLLHQEGRPEIDWTTKYIVFSKFESPAKVREWKRERESDLIERIPHTWPSSHENCFHSTLGSVSYCVGFLRRPPYWSVRVVLCNFKLGG